MICHKCGNDNKGGGRICNRCNALLDLHEIDMNNIDVSGLALAEDEDEKKPEKKSIGGLPVKIVLAGIVVVIGVVAAILLPDYLSQARAAIILEAITTARNGVEVYVKEHRVWPASETDINSRMPDHIKTDVTLVVRKGVIELSIPEEPGKKATLTPTIKKGRIIWKCDNGGIGSEYLPVGCYR